MRRKLPGFKSICVLVIAGLILQGCSSSVIRTQYQQGEQIDSKASNSITELGRETRIEAVSDSKVRVYDKITYGREETRRYEKKRIDTVKSPSGKCQEKMIKDCVPYMAGIITIPAVLVIMTVGLIGCSFCSATDSEYNCPKEDKESVVRGEYYEDKKVITSDIKEIPVTQGEVKASIFNSRYDSNQVLTVDLSLESDGTASLNIMRYLDKLPRNTDLRITYEYGSARATTTYAAADMDKAVSSMTPPFLTIDRKVSLSGTLHNGVLEGGQSGTVRVTVKNSGKGTAFGVRLDVSGRYSGVTLPSSLSVGDVTPGESREVNIPLQAALDVESGTLTLSVQAREQYGKDSVPLRVQPAIAVKQVEKPQFQIESVVFSDRGGLAQGNGNGIPENGEIIETNFKVKNMGTGPAKGVKARIVDLPDGLQAVMSSVELGAIPPGGMKEGALSIQLPKLYRNKDREIPFNLEVSDSRPIGRAAKKNVTMPYQFNEPILRVADLEILDGDAGTSSIGNQNHMMNQGEQLEIKTYIENIGTLRAENVVVSLSTDRPSQQVSIDPSSVNLGRVLPSDKRRVASFTVNIPGSVEPGPINLTIRISQQDFPSQSINFAKAIYEADAAVGVADMGKTTQRYTSTASSPTADNIDEVPYLSDFRRNNACALVIGIGKYKRPGINRLPNAVADARAIRDYLINIGGIPKENVMLLTDEEATLTGIREKMEQLSWRAGKDSEVFIYFSGHGVPDLEKKAPYLLPYDGNPNVITATGYAICDMKQAVNGFRTKQVVIAMDACFTGEGRSVAPAGSKGVAWVDEERTATEAVILNASKENQASWDYPEKAHGIFTYYLLKGMRGAADSQKGDSYVYVDELFEYVKKEVPSTALQKYGVEQVPTRQGTGKGIKVTKRIQ